MGRLGESRQGDARAEILIDGEVAGSAKIVYDPRENSGVPASQQVVYWIGNDHTRKRGFHGIIDELRLSNLVQDYYERGSAWVDPARLLKPQAGFPYLRDAATCCFTCPSTPRCLRRGGQWHRARMRQSTRWQAGGT